MLPAGAAAADAASEPPGEYAELDPSAVISAITVNEEWQRFFRVAPGGSFFLKLSGPTELRFNVRIEGGPPTDPLMVAVQQDGKLLRLHGLQPPPDDAEVWSDRGLPVTEPAPIAVPVPTGRHTVALGWPREASGDALIAIEGTLLPPVKAEELAEAQPPPPPPKVVAEASTEVAPVAAVAPPPRYRFSFFGGAGRSDESHTASTALTAVGLTFAHTLEARRLGPLELPPLPLLAKAELRFSEQGYLTNQLAPDGEGLAGAQVDETRYDFWVGVGYDLGPRLWEGGRLVAMPVLGQRYLALSNGVFFGDLFGLDFGARGELVLSPEVSLRGGFGWTPNLLGNRTLSAVGAPLWLLTWDAGLALPLAGGYALELGYRGEVLALDNDARISNGLVIGFHAAF